MISVDVNDGASFIGPTSSVFGVLLQSLMVVQKTASHYQRQSSDLVISPKVGHIRWDQMGRADELMDAGYAAGLDSIPRLRALIDSMSSKPPLDADQFPEFLTH